MAAARNYIITTSGAAVQSYTEGTFFFELIFPLFTDLLPHSTCVFHEFAELIFKHILKYHKVNNNEKRDIFTQDSALKTC